MFFLDRIRSNLAVKMWLIKITLLSFSLALVFYIQNNSAKFMYYNLQLTETAHNISDMLDDAEYSTSFQNSNDIFNEIASDLECSLIILDKNYNEIYSNADKDVLSKLSEATSFYINENIVYLTKTEDEKASTGPFYENYYKYLQTEEQINVIYNFDEIDSTHVTVTKYKHLDDNFLIVAYKEDSFDNTLIKFYENYLIKMFFIIILVVSVISYFISIYFVKPVRIIERVVRDIRHADVNKELFIDRTDEIGSLSRTVEVLKYKLEKSDGLHKEIFSNISHELKSPIVLIAGYGELVRDITWKDDEKREEHLNLIIKEANRMTSMINDILDYSQVSTGNFTLKEEYIPLVNCLNSEVQSSRASAINYNLDIKMDFDFNESTIAYIDTIRFSQVLRNLFNNAINHSFEKENIFIRAFHVEDGIYISVENKGNRISDIDKGLIFNRYYRAQHQNSRREGSGIGLSIVKNIYEAHSFRYGIDFSKGYNIFYFIIPDERLSLPENNDEIENL